MGTKSAPRSIVFDSRFTRARVSLSCESALPCSGRRCVCANVSLVPVGAPRHVPALPACAVAALPLRCRCAVAALSLRCRCAVAALSLRCRCAVAALPLRCRCVSSLRVSALVSPSFQASSLQPGKSSLRVLRSVSVRFRLSSGLVRWLSSASSALRNFGCSPPSARVLGADFSAGRWRRVR